MRLGIRTARLVDGTHETIVLQEFDIFIPFSVLYEGLDFGPATSRSV